MDELKIEYMKTGDLIPYENNPRNNDDAVDYVANSIREFGFKVPIIIDSKNVIVAGHTRLRASQKLGLETVPCIRADDLTEDQIRAFRLADNKASEFATWDLGKLEIELEDIEIDMQDFGFDFQEPEEDDGYYGDERERTFNATNFRQFDQERATGRYDMPVLQAVDHVPQKMIGFNYALTSNDYDACIHFFLDDYQFERVWNQPERYIEILKKFDCCLTPNYSIYRDMPEAVKIWNTYRGRLLGQMMQDNGIVTIPIVYWGERLTWDYCFDGIPEESTIATNNIIDDDDYARYIWDEGMKELLRRKRPKRILLYGNDVECDFDFGDTEVLVYVNDVVMRMRGEV